MVLGKERGKGRRKPSICAYRVNFEEKEKGRKSSGLAVRGKRGGGLQVSKRGQREKGAHNN